MFSPVSIDKQYHEQIEREVAKGIDTRPKTSAYALANGQINAQAKQLSMQQRRNASNNTSTSFYEPGMSQVQPRGQRLSSASLYNYQRFLQNEMK